MRKIHLDQCESTQKFLIENFKNGNCYNLVSCNYQSAGIGRGTNQWHQLDSTLCFSFTLKSHSKLTMTSLEIALILIEYFNIKFSALLKIKWPNDLLDRQGKKCGGILIHTLGQNLEELVVGVGINLFESQEQFNFNPGGVLDKPRGSLLLKDKENLAWDIYSYIYKNRLTTIAIRENFKKHCIHLNQNVSIHDNEEIMSGVFREIGDYGEAILELPDKTLTKIYNGSLKLII
jgi:biotin-[acetyl-CoA-carboxylase] ligase BirA-like protein